MKNFDCLRFFIVGNDHTFWVGKESFDYFVEFRDFGISLAVERRGIPVNKILHIPYYPINNRKPFEGFPFDRKGKIVGISGANLYKYLLDTDLKYFNSIKQLLEENKNFIFCLTGWGNEDKIKEFITTNKLETRFYFLGHRSDFYTLVGQCDILFESYPLKGGLTPLFAIEQNIPCVGIATFDNASGSLEEFFGVKDYKQPTNFDEFKKEATKLIQSETYRKELALLLSKNRCNKADFENSLKMVLNENIEKLIPKTVYPLKLNDENYLDEYLSLPESNLEELMCSKLFILKDSLPFYSRLKAFRYAVKSVNTKRVYDVFRLLSIVLIGK